MLKATQAERVAQLLDLTSRTPNNDITRMVIRELANTSEVDGLDAEDRLVGALYTSGLKLLLERISAQPSAVPPIEDLSRKLSAIDRAAVEAAKDLKLRRKIAARESAVI